MDVRHDSIATLQTQARAAKRAFHAVQDAFERDRKEAWRCHRKQNPDLTKKYFATYELMDKLQGKLSWARSARNQAEAAKQAAGEFILPKHPTKPPPESTSPGVTVANQFTRLKWADENPDSEPDF